VSLINIHFRRFEVFTAVYTISTWPHIPEDGTLKKFKKFKIHPLGSKFLLSLLTLVMDKRHLITESFSGNFTQTFFVGDSVPEVQLLIKGPKDRL
jgi:hypothetical protein